MGDQLIDESRVCRHNRDSYHDIEDLSDQMAAWTAKVDNNNRNNPNRGGEPIPVIRVCNNIPTIVTYRKSKYSNESDLEYYERRYYTRLKDDYYKFEISDSIYRCPFCYNKDYSLTGLLRHAFRIAGNSCSRKMVKDIARHSVLITYILRFLTPLKEDIDVARTTEAFSTSVEPVEEHSVTEPIVIMEETDLNEVENIGAIDEHVEVSSGTLPSGCVESTSETSACVKPSILMDQSSMFPITVPRQTLPTVSSTALEPKETIGGTAASKRKIKAWSKENLLWDVVHRWGMVGIKGQDKVHDPYSSRESAIQEFEQKFLAKTKNAWCDMNNFVSHPKSYVWLEVNYGDKEKESTATESVSSVPNFSKAHETLHAKFNHRLNAPPPKPPDIGHDTSKIVDSIQDRDINQVYILGEFGTQNEAAMVFQEIRRRGLKVAVVGFGTIDNYIPVIDKSIGFDTVVAEALNETVCISDKCTRLIVIGKYYFRIDHVGEGARWRRTFGQEIYSPSLLASTESKGNGRDPTTLPHPPEPPDTGSRCPMTSPSPPANLQPTENQFISVKPCCVKVDYVCFIAEESEKDQKGRISGAAIRNYLLEQSRVCQVYDPERNYQCFYIICAAPQEDVDKLKLGNSRNFHYLNQSNCIELDALDDAKEYLATRRAMEVVGISTDEHDAIFQIIVVVFHLRNIEFVRDYEKVYEGLVFSDEIGKEADRDVFVIRKVGSHDDRDLKQAKSVLLVLSMNSFMKLHMCPQFTVPTFKATASDCLWKVQFGKQIALVRMKPPRPLSTREAIAHYYLFEYIQDDLIVVLLKTVIESEKINETIDDGFNNDVIPEAKGVVRIDLLEGCYTKGDIRKKLFPSNREFGYQAGFYAFIPYKFHFKATYWQWFQTLSEGCSF